MKKFIHSVLLLSVLALASLAIHQTLEQPGQAQPQEASQISIKNPTIYNLKAFTLADNPTASACFVDQTFTNFFRVSGTNCNLELQLAGTLYSGVSSNVICTNGTGTRTLVIKNGLVVQVQ